MKSSEVTYSHFTDYSKAFDTIDFSVLIKEMHILNFSKRSIYWIPNYLTDSDILYKLIQIFSNLLIINFGIPQPSRHLSAKS